MQLSNDVKDFTGALKHCLQNGSTAATGVIGGAVSLFAMSSKLTLVAVAMVPLTTAMFTYFGKVVRGFSQLERKANASAQVPLLLLEYPLTYLPLTGRGLGAGHARRVHQQHPHGAGLRGRGARDRPIQVGGGVIGMPCGMPCGAVPRGLLAFACVGYWHS
jgi:hypothetical protein